MVERETDYAEVIRRAIAALRRRRHLELIARAKEQVEKLPEYSR